MKPKVSETKEGGVQLVLSVPENVDSVKDSKIIWNWRMKYEPLSNESVALMFADELEARIRKIEVTEKECYIELEFANEMCVKDYIHFARQI
ncbi:MAG: hypothetical protein IKE01_07125 [Clostridia bacterium]|nr:hypothetical protein [Clostridia bacterium]